MQARQSPPARLVTISMSHYCEKARWALERVGLPYLEERHPPVLHVLSAWRAGGRRTVPVLVTNGRTFADSTDILKHLDSLQPAGLGLYPTDPVLRREAEELEDLFDTQLGPATRRYAFFYLLEDRAQVVRMVCEGTSPVESALFRTFFPAVRGLMRRGLKITPESAERSRQKVDKVLATVSERLADGRPYLVGDRFGAADLTFASMAAPAVGPAEYGIELPSLEQAPTAFGSQVQAWRATPAGQFALRLYREERKAPRAGVSR